jgi:hypothetical protein
LTPGISVTETKVPLYLLPGIITRLLIRKGDAVYRISVKRTCQHHYNISVRTKSLPKVPGPGCLVIFPAHNTSPAAAGNGTCKEGRERET